MRSKIKLSLCALLVGSVIGVHAADPAGVTAPNSAKTKIYNESNQNVIVDRDNPTFTINLKSNPTTGYSWFVREYDPNVIKPVSHRFYEADVKQIGAPGHEMFVFTMKPDSFNVPSQTVLRLTYARPFQGNDGAKQIVFYVTSIATPKHLEH